LYEHGKIQLELTKKHKSSGEPKNQKENGLLAFKSLPWNLSAV
jgi:hypothetical protein